MTGQAKAGATDVVKTTWAKGELVSSPDRVATEAAVALVYNGISHVVMMATPLDLEDFALGFSLSEGILDRPNQLLDFSVEETTKGYEVQLAITNEAFARLQNRRRNLAGRTGCGLCGAEALEQVIEPLERVTDDRQISHKALQRVIASVQDHQPLQGVTGAVHGAAWCAVSGEIVLVREDVGRHNALDKLLGALSQQENSKEREPGFILVSSRASYEMVVKAARANVGVLAAVSAPTSLAIELAESCGMTLVAFAREQRHVIYTDSSRLIGE